MAHSAEARIGGVDVASDADVLRRAEGSDEGRLWASLAKAQDAAGFCQAWLDLQCGRTRGATTALILLQGSEGSFAPAATWPSGPQDHPHLRDVAEQALSAGQVVVKDDADNPGATTIGYPITSDGQARGAVLMAVTGLTAPQLQLLLRELHWGVGWLHSLIWQHRAAGEGERGVASIAAMDVLAAVQEHDTLSESVLALCNALAVGLKADRVSLGLVRKDAVKLAAMSHGAWFRKRSDVAEALEAAMDEATDQGMALSLPKVREGDPVTLQQARLLALGGKGAVASVPMLDRGLPVGVMLLERAADAEPFTAQDLWMAETIAALVAPGIALKQREERWIGGRVRRHGMDGAKALFGPRRPLAKALGIGTLLLLLFLFVPLAQFQVRADAELEGQVQRAASAPFSGFIARSQARAGDVVKAGQVLATLDDRDLRVDRARALGEVQQLDRRYREALAKHERAEMSLAGAQLRQAEASLRLIEYKLARTRIVAPLSGVLVSGDLSQKVGTPVEEGDVLFEVAPMGSYRVALNVEEQDVNYLRPGQQGRFAPTGLAGDTVPFTVRRITSVTSNVDGQNLFRVEAELAGGRQAVLRPGMEGVAKVEIDRRSNFWIWTRSLREWLRLFFWKWLP
jgi:GAF domain-containing protein/biotin carboxyl carrier protein